MNGNKNLYIILILLLVLALSGLFFYLYTTDLFITSVEARGRADIRQLSVSLADDSLTAQQVVKQQAPLIDAVIIIIDADSYLVADSRKRSSAIVGKYIDADVSEAKKQGHILSTRRDTRAGLFIITVAERLTVSNRDIVISVIYRIRETGQFFWILVMFILSLSIILLVLILAYSRLSVLQYRKPLSEFLKFTESSGGGLNKIYVESEHPEFLLLAEQFNNLVDRYNHLIISDNRKYSRINTLLAHLKTGMLMVNTENSIVMVNQAAENMLNLNKVRLFKIRDKEHYHNETLEIILKECSTVNKTYDSVLLSVKTPDENLLEVSIDAVFSKYEPNEHSGSLVILQDVTEMRRLERLKDDFVANVSHELKTPLTIINGFVETLKSWENIDTEDRNTALNIIDIESQRLKKLINELLQLSQITGEMGEVRRKRIDPGKVLRELVQSLGVKASEKEIETELNIKKDLEIFSSVPGWFRQIIMNIYDNALKYSPPGSKVYIRLFDKVSDRAEKDLVLEIRDSGMGIPPGDIEKIFERFYRGEKRKNRNISGSGLGLTIAKHMAEELKGSIEAESELGKGSCFRLVLPRLKENIND
jgi:two-component system, OmpR family, phosphate regulon sensor histidine kinase PhoR